MYLFPGNNTFSSLNKQQLSWEDADRTCRTGGLLQLSQHDDNPFEALNINHTAYGNEQWNISYWLGLYKQKCPEVRIKRLGSSQNIGQSIFDKKFEQCHYVEKKSNASGDCSQKNHVICIKPGEIVYIDFKHLLSPKNKV